MQYFVSHKSLSKRQVEAEFAQHLHSTSTNRSVSHHRPEILAAFKYLEKARLIANVGYANPGPGMPLGVGRPRVYYEITNEGLKQLISDKSISGLQFWKILVDYSLNQDRMLTSDKLDELLQIFIWRHLKYRDHGFTTYFEIFHTIYNKWLMERVSVSNRVSVIQKVLEVLAINPKISLNDLVEKVAEPEANVKEVLSLYSSSQRSLIDTDIINNDYSKENSDFIIRNIITANQEKDGDLTYELSLFGVMLTLLILLYNDMKKLKHGIYIKKYSFKKYCDKIAYNYSHKLPLVFGKWDRLRQILQVFAIYNFVVLLPDGLINNESNSLSVIMEGNEEIFQGVRKILQYNKRLMQDLLNAGLEVLGDYFLVRFDLSVLKHLKNDASFQRINLICALAEEIMILLNPLWYRYPRLSLITFTAQDPNRILKHMEESFADEISACYYMNFLKPNIDVDEMKMRYERLLTKGSKDLRIDLGKCLSLLIQEVKGDPSTRDWARKWSEDLSSVYQEIDKIVKTWSSSHIFW